MNSKKKEIPTGSLIENYLPADYADTFSWIVICKQAITPDEFRVLAFGQVPKWIDWLMKLRNCIVQPLGLDTKSKFVDMIHAQNSDEVIFGMPDKHLSFYVSMWCGEYKDGRQELQITTVVKYNNWIGRVYFFIIKPFHSIIIRSILNNIKAPHGTLK
ncbi:DUF2867 domain-containing protein [Parabacteroides sp.]